MISLLAGMLDPYRLLFLILGVGIGSFWRRRSVPVGRLLLASLPFAGLVVLSTPAVAHVSLGTLEWWYPPVERRPKDAEAIAVLGGGMDRPDATRLHAEMDSNTLFRCLHAADLYRHGKPCPVVVCGGKIAPGASIPSLASLMRDFLRDQGVDEDDIVVEDRSRTTYENAVECRKLLDQRRIRNVVLVTDAAHMFRALRCFRKRGIEAVPSACHHGATQFEWTVMEFLPSASAVRNHQRAFHEWMGCVWYWVRGYL